MWETFPIQKGGVSGPDCQTIDRTFLYKKSEDVVVMPWKEVDEPTKKWCVSLWKEQFNGGKLGDDDLVGWIPSQGTIVAKYGKWIGKTRSRNVGYINYLYVTPLFRKGGVANRLIETILYHGCLRWGSSTGFLFEVQSVPRSLSLQNPDYMCRFSYVWVPFTLKSAEKKWKPADFRPYLSNEMGFIGNYTGWKGYKYEEDILVFDSHGDIVWYSNVLTLCTFDGFETSGAYCRIFSPLGNVTVFAENMYFTATFGHHVLG